MEHLNNNKKKNNNTILTAAKVFSLATILIVAIVGVSSTTLTALASRSGGGGGETGFTDPTADLKVPPRAPSVVSGDNIYIAWWTNNTENGNEEVMFRASNDGGETFGPMLMLATNGTIGSTEEEGGEAVAAVGEGGEEG